MMGCGGASLAWRSENDSAALAVLWAGKAGTQAFWSRSLPPKLMRRLDAAFLLVPAEAGGRWPVARWAAAGEVLSWQIICKLT